MGDDRGQERRRVPVQSRFDSAIGHIAGEAECPSTRCPDLPSRSVLIFTRSGRSPYDRAGPGKTPGDTTPDAPTRPGDEGNLTEKWTRSHRLIVSSLAEVGPPHILRAALEVPDRYRCRPAWHTCDVATGGYAIVRGRGWRLWTAWVRLIEPVLTWISNRFS